MGEQEVVLVDRIGVLAEAVFMGLTVLVTAELLTSEVCVLFLGDWGLLDEAQTPGPRCNAGELCTCSLAG